ncbi:hypothetical protein CTI12_AA126620 [Artemisia annua]|uniref:RRM domain-containing protein n=1 Tax=Artemisia annua TaxID=35608 RepID=A0A2U1PNL1_ARTAN|nr:hypothetical protein CTI12_AA126620 [Artemisia annua]
MHSQRSKEDQVLRISKSVFVTNFPDYFGYRDLWKLCESYGKVIDVFIPNRLSKAGKWFAFVRFIKVTDMDRLIGNLCTLWVDRFHLHANVVRYERSSIPVRNPLPKSHPQPSKPHNHVSSSFVSAVKGNSNVHSPLSPAPTLVLDDACVVERNLDNYVMGEVMQFSSIVNLCVLLSAEGFNNVKLTYLGGLWVMMELDSLKTKAKFMKHVGVASWFSRLCNAQPDLVSKERLVWVDIEGVPLHAWSRATFDKIGAKWGEVMELEECNDDLFARKRICIKTKQEENILEKFKIIVRGKIFVVRAKELFVWSPVFKDVKDVVYWNDGDNCRSVNLDAESDVEGVSETDFGVQKDELDYGQAKSVNDKEQSVNDKEYSSDPFNIYSLLNKQKAGVNFSAAGTSLSHPQGFTPEKDGHVSNNQEDKMANQASPQSHSVGLSSRVMQDASPVVETIISDASLITHCTTYI